MQEDRERLDQMITGSESEIKTKEKKNTGDSPIPDL